MEIVLFVILGAVFCGAFATLWVRSESGRHRVDDQLSVLRERVARLEGASSGSPAEDVPEPAEPQPPARVEPTAPEPESFAEAAQRARQLTDDDREAARARLREHRSASGESASGEFTPDD